MMMRFLLVCSLGAALAAAGTRPRASSFDYRTQATSGDVTIGAEIIPPAQVRNLFATDLSKYVVVEVAVYPKDATTANLQKLDFALKVGSDVVRAANPAAIAKTRQQASTPRPSSPSDINVYPTAEIGYESGPYHRGVYTATGVGVAVGGPPAPPGYPPAPASTGADRDVMRQELADNELPEGATSKPVAGYLYFPVSSKKKATYDLEFYGPDGKIRLMLK
jgi:hypothetical protein